MNTDADLEVSLKRLMGFRVVMVTTLLFIATYVEAVSETLYTVNPLYFVIGATYALTVVHVIALRFVRQRLLLAHVQLLGDLLMVTALVYATGGVRTGFLLLYPLTVLSATMLVQRRGALLLAGVATALYGGLLGIVRAGLIPPGRARRARGTCRRERSSTPCSCSGWPARRSRSWAPTSRRASGTRASSCARRRSRSPTCAGSTR